jgi:hypothetical protein
LGHYRRIALVSTDKFGSTRAKVLSDSSIELNPKRNEPARSEKEGHSGRVDTPGLRSSTALELELELEYEIDLSKIHRVLSDPCQQKGRVRFGWWRRTDRGRPQSMLAYCVLRISCFPPPASEPSLLDTYLDTPLYGGMPSRPRRSHNKSRGGCTNCKRRRIKV